MPRSLSALAKARCDKPACSAKTGRNASARLDLEAVAADDRLVIRALIRHATAMAVGRWKDAAAVIENLDYTDRGECR